MYQSRQGRAFEGLDGIAAKHGLGFYCDLQSLHSEDAITWSVFGTLKHGEKVQKEKWLCDFLALVGLVNVSTSEAEFFLWRRIPHPNTLVPGGPEIDFGIITRNAVILGEAKWQSGVGVAQGKKKDKDQIQLRGEFLKGHGRGFFPGKEVVAVIGLSLLPNAFQNTVPDGVAFGAVTWEQVCSLPSHPQADEVKRYYLWKKTNTKTASRPFRATSQ
jgi:hypothetical protein